MSDNKYPRFGSAVPISTGICDICGKDSANSEYHIENDFMRNNDSIYNVHSECVAGLELCKVLHLVKKNIKILGREWGECYLHDNGCEDRKAQVLNDLKEVIKKGDFKQWDTLTIDCKDHTGAFELFQISQIISWCNVVLNYAGGDS